MKNLIKISIILLFTISIFSCSSSTNDNTSPEKRIQGEWEVVNAEGGMSDLNKGTIYSFEDNIMTTGGTTTGKFSVSDSLITWDLGSMQMQYVFYFEDNTLILELNSGQKLYLKKQ